ncbi:MAG: helix-turn-helix domain-containing protein [Eubacterium sp.]|jgi:transcriptional regulator with XRE-family HTH domain
MDQVQIGKFIASERKQKGLTQRQLADELGISDKTISKWETGNGFPEISLVLPLCEHLDINVNELLTGERLSDKEYKQKAEENMVDMIREKEANQRNLKLTNIVGVMSTTVFIVLMMIVAIYGYSMPKTAAIILAVTGIGVFAVGLYVATQGERTIGYYKCHHCGQKVWAKKVMSRDED